MGPKRDDFGIGDDDDEEEKDDATTASGGTAATAATTGPMTSADIAKMAKMEKLSKNKPIKWDDERFNHVRELWAMFRGLLLHPVVVIFHIEWCIGESQSSSIVSYNITSLKHNQHTNIHLTTP